ncbi:uncharacterized protein [Palaemon carinicauda]|uniref:uncharacterized protein n=1 Tax=Palaemon carinicauda TaxID=392227 RepID=UPI0035B5AF7A
MNVKKVLSEKAIVPTVMYGSELWGMKVTERQKLNVFEMKCLKSKAAVSQLDRLRDEIERVRMGVRNELAVRVDMNVMRRFDHVERMENDCQQKMMNARVGGRSTRGWPKLGWMNGIKKALHDKRMDVRSKSAC